MKITFGRFLLRSIKYIVLMNIFLFMLCACFNADFDPTLLGSVIVPVLCAYASLWSEKRRFEKMYANRRCMYK